MGIVHDTITYTPQPGNLNKALSITLYILIAAVFFLASFVAYLLIFFVPPLPSELDVYELQQYIVENPGAYNDPIDTLTLSNESVLITDKKGGDLTVSVIDHAVYKYGYYSSDGKNWDRFVFENDGEVLEDAEEVRWLAGNTSYKVIIEPDDFNITRYPYGDQVYVGVYTCSKDFIGLWDCHGGWQISTVDVEIEKQKEPVDECGGCPEGYDCINGRCVIHGDLKRAMNVRAGESLLVETDEHDYLILVTSIDGDGLTAGLSIDGEAFNVDDDDNDYVKKGELRFIVKDIAPFSLGEGGYVEIIVLSDYDNIAICENCVYTENPISIPSGGGSSGGGGGGSVSCTPKTCTGLGYICGSWSDGCGGTLECDACDAGYECVDGASCVCIPDCTGKQCGPDGCGGSCGDCTDYGAGYICVSDINMCLPPPP